VDVPLWRMTAKHPSQSLIITLHHKHIGPITHHSLITPLTLRARYYCSKLLTFPALTIFHFRAEHTLFGPILFGEVFYLPGGRQADFADLCCTAVVIKVFDSLRSVYKREIFLLFNLQGKSKRPQFITQKYAANIQKVIRFNVT